MMEDKLTIEARGLGNDYYNHKIFNFLEDLFDFYGFLSDSCCNTADGCLITGKYSVNSNIYSSVQGTVESIKILAYAGRLNDSFALTRKYEDAVYVDLYTNILLEQDEQRIVNLEEDIRNIWNNSIVRKWTLQGKKLWKPNELQKIKNTIKQVDSTLGTLLEKVWKKSDNRGQCNNNVHYNSWENFAINDYCYLQGSNKGVSSLNELYDIVLNILVIHFSYTYIQKFPIFGSSDYVDCLDLGIEPEKDSQYWVAPIAQNIFDKYIKKEYKEVADYLIDNGVMNLE